MEKTDLPQTQPQTDGLLEQNTEPNHALEAGVKHQPPTTLSSLKYLVTCSYLNILLVFVPIGIAVALTHQSAPIIFCMNFLAIVPLAKLMGMATEEIALRTNQTIGGLLNATFGNMVEAIVAVLALRNGLVQVVQSSLLGSILSNLLLVLGFKYKTQTYNITAAQTAASLFCMTILALFLPAVLEWNKEPGKDSHPAVVIVSRLTAIVLFVVYILYLVFQLKTHTHYFADESGEEEEPQITLPVSIALLLVATVLVALNAEYLVDSIDGLSKAWGLSENFVGLILLPIVGNAAEHVSAVTVAMKNKMNLVIGIAVGSSMQIALFVTPLAVIAGWILGKEMTLAFTPIETVVVFVAIFIVNSLISDGESNWLEGALLLASYLVVAVVFWFY
ncbi:hypothetical protein HK098_007888 [Nowakowskiella sp. JEL0407]|nr:hypothetical protein HK098_007888 [Nowakowskiella sp. JEL0407]